MADGNGSDFQLFHTIGPTHGRVRRGSIRPVPQLLEFRVEVRGIPVAHRLELIECIHIGLQGSGSHSPIQSDSKTGRVPGGEVLAGFLRSIWRYRPGRRCLLLSGGRCAEPDDFRLTR